MLLLLAYSLQPTAHSLLLADTHYVDINSTSPTPPHTSWGTAAQDIQSAVDYAAAGDTVLVANGTYYITREIDIFDPVAVRSLNGAALTKIDGNQVCECVYIAHPGASVSGFTIKNGYSDYGGGVYCSGGTLSNCVIADNYASDYGGGVYCRSGGSIQSCTISDNWSDWGGGGIRCYDGGLVSNCVVVGNYALAAGGGMACYSNVVVRDCVISGNETDNAGGGLFCQSSTVLMNGCLLNSNYAGERGGGTCDGTFSNCTLTNNLAVSDGGGAYYGMFDSCRVVGNSAFLGGGGVYAGTDTIKNSLIMGNSSWFQGGGVYAGVVRNCTVINNFAMYGGGTFGSTVQNAIIYYNFSWASQDNQDMCSLEYSCTMPDPGGMGNITNEPGLVGAGNPHLLSSSPCINAGTNAYASGAVDIDGEARISGEKVDMGCDEFVSGALTGALSVAIVAACTNAVVQTPLRFEAVGGGKVGGFAWDFGDGSVASGLGAVEHAYAGVGNYAVVVQAWNSDHSATATAVVRVVSGFTNFVALGGGHVAPFTNVTTAARNIQAAIDAAAAGGCVLVGGGVYDTGECVISGTRNRVGINKPLTVMAASADPRDTVIRGSSPMGESAARCAYVGKYGRLTGFTLTNGNTRLAGDFYWGQSGGGVWCEKGGAVSRCLILGNSASYYGGGVFGGTADNCMIGGNSSASAFGGGAAGSDVRNCTIIGNSANAGGGVAWTDIKNSIIYNNMDSGKYNNVYIGVYKQCEFSCTIPDPGGTGNITNEPGLMGGGNPHLLVGSPCIDAGTNAYVLGATDIDGDERISGMRVDIGCDELVIGSLTGALSVAIASACTNAVVNAPMRFEAVGNGSVVGYAWDFGDGSVEDGLVVVEHAYAEVGEYKVVLRAWNSEQSATATAGVRVVTGFTNYVALGGGHVAPFTSWATAATDIQAAVDAAVAGGCVVVGIGMYDRGECAVYGTRNRVGIDKPLTVIAASTNPRDTVIQGLGPLGDAAMRCAYVGKYGRLIGFTLTNGYTRLSGDMVRNRSGGGAWNDGGVISNCMIVGNHASSNGGGLFGGAVFGSTVAHNSADGDGGGVCQAKAQDSSIEGNRAQWSGGGALGGSLVNCVIVDNSAGGGGGGVAACDLQRCRVMRNSADSQGGGVYGGSLRSCVIAENSALTDGGGVFFGDVQNCTIVSNSAARGGGIFQASIESSVRLVSDSILYFNTASGSGDNHNAAGLYVACCTTPAPPGTNNVTGDPKFAGLVYCDFRLSPGSPCIDRGLNVDWMFGASDLDGKPRIRNGAVDMGAYEFAFEADLKGFLQGAYSTNVHAMMPTGNSDLPSTTPYETDVRRVAGAPSNTVDWMMVEVQGTNGSSVASASVFLDPAGRLMDETGTHSIPVEVSAGYYYLVLRHRNHLAAMSALPVAFTNTVVSYDFTAGPDKYFGGTNACVELEPGLWGLMSGDADGDGRITPVDREIVRRQRGMTGYLQGDLNLDGKVDGDD